MKKAAVKQTGGRWDPKGQNIYFLAATASDIPPVRAMAKNILVALDQIQGGTVEDLLTMVEQEGKTIFIDSGAYALAAEVARNEDVPLSAVFGRKAQVVPGFDKLLGSYLSIIGRLKDSVWGYVELDFGGPDGKRETRRMLEDKGLRPIPVYHPFADPPEYFDEIASQYDRIAVGGLVGLSRMVKIRIAATIHHRSRKYPGLWVHALGIGPSDVTAAFPANSCDASTWVGLVRWPDSLAANAGNTRFSTVSHHYTYEIGSDQNSEKGLLKAKRLGAYDGHMAGLNWRAQMAVTHWLTSTPGGPPP